MDTTNKLFIPKYGFFQNIKSINTINTQADNAFKYQISSVDTIGLFVNSMSYSFTISTNLRYNNYKFKGLLIDLSAATRSTSGIRQLKALQRGFSMKLDKTID